MNRNPYLALEDAVRDWCKKRPDILAGLVIGSRGREAASPDRRSDLDLLFFCRKADNYRESHAWLDHFGEVWIAALNFVGPGHPEWMIYLAPGLKADFLFVTANPGQTLADMLDSLPYQQVLTRGFRLLYRSPTVAGEPVLTGARPRDYTLPTEWIFQQKVNATLFTAERFVKFAIRSDDWRSRYTFEAELKAHLLAFIEWHAQAWGGSNVDTWYEGRHMATWADSRFTGAVRHLDPGHHLSQQQAALSSFLDLFQSLAGETATRLGYEFPTGGQRKMMAWLQATMLNASG
ncbi:MAG: aminoglycoside 6-adenylyltransferase [Candidatus Promineifilaceae bacterium]